MKAAPNRYDVEVVGVVGVGETVRSRPKIAALIVEIIIELILWSRVTSSLLRYDSLAISQVLEG